MEMGSYVFRDWLLVPLGFTLVLVPLPHCQGAGMATPGMEWSLEGVADRSKSEKEQFTNFS